MAILSASKQRSVLIFFDTAQPIDDRRQIHKTRLDANISDVRHPNLIEPRHLSPMKKIRINPIAVIRIGRRYLKPSVDLSPQPVLSHHSVYPLAIDSLAIAPQQLPIHLSNTVLGKPRLNQLDQASKVCVYPGALAWINFGFVVVAAARYPYGFTRF
jgi:hypothetical protein